MFGLSTWEVLIILAVALIFVGPDQLPKVARQIGKGVRQVRSAVGKVDDEMRRAVREAAAQFDDDGNPLDDDDVADKPATPPRDPHALEPLPMPIDPSLANAAPPAPAPNDPMTPPAVAGQAAGTQAPQATPNPPAQVAAVVEVAPGPMARDWSQVGKAPVPGRVATAVSTVSAATPAEPEADADQRASEPAPRPEKPAA